MNSEGVSKMYFGLVMLRSASIYQNGSLQGGMVFLALTQIASGFMYQLMVGSGSAISRYDVSLPETSHKAIWST